MSDIIINTSIDQPRRILNVEVSIAHLQNLSSHRAIETLLNELITKTVKTIVMQQYGELQKMVDDVIFSDEIRDLIRIVIREEIVKAAKEHFRDMFGDK